MQCMQGTNDHIFSEKMSGIDGIVSLQKKFSPITHFKKIRIIINNFYYFPAGHKTFAKLDKWPKFSPKEKKIEREKGEGRDILQWYRHVIAYFVQSRGELWRSRSN